MFLPAQSNTVEFKNKNHIYKWNDPADFSTRPNSLWAAAESPPKAVPLHTRPVTSWKGRVEISCPAPATPIMTLSPHPLWQASRAALWEGTRLLLSIESPVQAIDGNKHSV